MKLSIQKPVFYILRSLCFTNQIYIGSSRDLQRRIHKHNSGNVPHTSKFKPWIVVYFEEFDNYEEASKRERQVKRWTRVKKEALIRGDWVELKRL